jgi:UDP-N-acetyl-2-amino-2-deoxyglucuronate dehydrogenase
MLRMAILGVGWAGTRQTQAAQELGRKVVVDCLVDRDEVFLQERASELDIDKTYTDIGQALADPEVDAVSICLPHNLHHPVTLRAAAAGKHVLVEKPIAMTVDEATEMIAATQEAGVALYVAENAVYTSMCRTLRHMVQTQEPMGELTFAALTIGFHAPDYGYPGRRSWLSTPEEGGSGVWLLNGIHTVAKLRYVLGEVETVYMGEHKATNFRRRDVEGTMSGLFTLESGVQVWLVQSPETRLRGLLAGFRLYGVEGTVLGAEESYALLPNDDDMDSVAWQPYPEQALSSYALELEAFADYVAGVAVGPTTAESERRSLAVVQAGYESAACGQPVHLRERFGL